jgi:hypothetical protein
MELCLEARNNPNMISIWGGKKGSWWKCMTGCVSFQCQGYLDEKLHGEP